jgi:antitoxin component YwqK of YwqJK toxin-antitoxin module
MSSEQSIPARASKSYRKSENKKLLKKYRDGKLEGEYRSWYGNGMIETLEFYKRGKLEGEQKYWHSNGQLFRHLFYRDGKPEGNSKTWHKNGQIWGKDFYRNGTSDGICKIWGAEGQMISNFYMLDAKLYYFSMRKNHAFLKVKKHLHTRQSLSIIDSYIIPDLSRSVFVS